MVQCLRISDVLFTFRVSVRFIFMEIKLTAVELQKVKACNKSSVKLKLKCVLLYKPAKKISIVVQTG